MWNRDPPSDEFPIQILISQNFFPKNIHEPKEKTKNFHVILSFRNPLQKFSVQESIVAKSEKKRNNLFTQNWFHFQRAKWTKSPLRKSWVYRSWKNSETDFMNNRRRYALQQKVHVTEKWATFLRQRMKVQSLQVRPFEGPLALTTFTWRIVQAKALEIPYVGHLEIGSWIETCSTSKELATVCLKPLLSREALASPSPAISLQELKAH